MSNRWLYVSLLFVLICSACQQGEVTQVTRDLQATSAAADIPTPGTAPMTPVSDIPEIVIEVTRVIDVFVEQPGTVELDPPRELTVCMQREPQSLFRYKGEMSPSEQALQHAIYANDYTTLTYRYAAAGLEKLPTFEDRDLFWREVTLTGGEMVTDAQSQLPVTLALGTKVETVSGEIVSFDGNPIQMRQMVADFRLKPRFWSDGRPVLASDSAFGYDVAAHPDTPADKFRIARTAEYVPLDERTVRWVGIPGYVDRDVVHNFAKPLPQHLLQTVSPAEMVSADLTARRPIGDGPFRLVEWRAGDEIRLVKNEHYYRQSEGLPRVDEVIFRFVSEPSAMLSQLLSGECDIGTQEVFSFDQAALLIEAGSRNQLTPHFAPGLLYEHIDFGIDSYGAYGDAAGRPDWFEDARVRQAITLCTDRQRMVDEIFLGRSMVMHSFFPAEHPLYSDEVTVWPFDPEQGNQLLDEAGFPDENGDGIREAFDERPFQITFGLASGNLMRQQIAQFFAEDMTTCGIGVDLVYYPADEWYAPGPDGPLFGRRFDLGQFAWPVDASISCRLYMGSEVPGPVEEGYIGWQGLNHTGWRSDRFDTACRGAQVALPGSDAYVAGHKLAAEIFSDTLPAMPLFPRLKVAATRPEVLNFQLDTTQASELVNIDEIDLDKD